MTKNSGERSAFQIQATRRAMIASTYLGIAALAAKALTPTLKLAQRDGGLQLESAIPKKFASWQVDTQQQNGVVNPQTEQLLKATYNQTLSRTYVDSARHRVMLSIAYGEDQSDSGNEIHHPEVCYPAQGFQLRTQRSDTIQTPFGIIPAKRLETSLGSQRHEPVTYWIVIGDVVALTGLQKKAVELRLGLRGLIVDGLLFRTSTIDQDSRRSFAIQDGFIRDLLAASTATLRMRLAALA